MEPFKNVFSPHLVACLADHLQKYIDCFDRAAFTSGVLENLERLEFKDRAQLIADHMHLALPCEPAMRAHVLMAMLHPDEEDHANQPSDEVGICGWGVQPMAMLVGQHGIADFERSLDLLKQMTKRSSSEFGIRHFLLADQDRTLKIIADWVDDPNRHVRRLVSEGTRPRLPWAMQLPRLKADPAPMLPILMALRDDDEEYVRRSVANHLNDIAKDHPDLTAQLAKDWLVGADENRKKLLRHACRTLVKQGHRGALANFGFSHPIISLKELEIGTPVVIFGGAVEFSVSLRSTSNKVQSLLIDYLLHFRKANGQSSGKVFKWCKIQMDANEIRTLRRSHSIRPITTRRYYPGIQAISLRINGQDFGDVKFELVMPDGKSC